MNLSTPPFRWISAFLLLVVATALIIVAGSTLRRPEPPRPPAPPTPVPDQTAVAEPLRQRPDERKSPQVWAIAIGIDQYRDRAIPACHGAVHDARAVGRWFSQQAGWNAANVLYLDDLGQAEPGPAGDRVEHLLPTRANLEWAFRWWLGARVRPDDQIVVYFAGQAAAIPPPQNAPASQPAQPYLLPADARLSDCERTGWRLDEAIDPWAATGRNPIVCWLDTSLHGRGRSLPPAPEAGKVETPAPVSLLPSLVRWPGVTAWLAAEGRTSAEPTTVGEFSPFTGALLAALGTPVRPANLNACLAALKQDPALTRQGFRMLGGVDPNLTLWSSGARHVGLKNRELVLQRGHAGGVAVVTFTADGDRLITGAQDSTIKVWRVSDRMVLRADASHLVGVTCLDLSLDGRWLASGDGSGRLRLRNMVNELDVPTGPPHDRGVYAVAFLPDGEHIVSLDDDGASWLWNTANPSTDLKPLSKAKTSTGLTCARGRHSIGFALADADGKLRLFGPEGQALKTLDGPGGLVTSRRLATDGRMLAAADDERRLILWDATSDAVVFRSTMDAPIETLALAPTAWLAVAAGKEIALVAIDPETPQFVSKLPLPDPANLLAFSRDGRWLAAGTASGRAWLWRLTDEKQAEPVPLEDEETTGRTTTLSFAPDGRSLVSGDQDGGIRTWELPRGRQRPRVPARRGQVAALSVSGDGRYLLQITQDWQAQVWDLQEGRSLSRIEGNWTSGVLAPDGESLYLTTLDEGNLVVVDRTRGLPRPLRFERPAAQRGAGTSTQRFARAAVSRDGRWVAAGSTEGPLACVWDAATGRLAQTLTGHRDPHPITAVAFSTDASRLLTASEDGTAILWDLSDPAKPAHSLSTYALTDPNGGEPIPISTAALAPGEPLRVVTGGGVRGQVLLWEEGARQGVELGPMDHPVLATTFTPDGRWLAAAGADRSVWVWDLKPTPRRIRLEPLPHHAEQVNALIGWPGSKVIASGSDDSTIRFWNLDKSALLGTISAEQGTVDWVAYTPDGLFDSSVGGERQVTWRDERGILSLDQVYDQFHVYKLTDKLRQGIRPEPPERPRRLPPRLSIDLPAAPVQTDRLAELTISLSEPDLVGVRLYQNGVPVQTDQDFRHPPGQQRFSTQVSLLPGLNRFHVMASRPGAGDVDGRSEVVEIRHDVVGRPGRLHVLALGVNEYNPGDRALQYADRDAKQLAGFLHETGVRAAAPGLTIVLTNREVSEARIDRAFVQIRDEVKERPEDTVAVFMAGHADTINGRFFLLLPSFPFRAPAPGPGAATASRGLVDRDTVLPYAAVYRNIVRLGALQRLVMIDACQAEAIGDDPGVRRVQELVDRDAQRARTAYLLAARRGEAAGESSVLEHGLMTYALLKGMGESSLETIPGLSLFESLPNADRNRDQVVTTEELRWFVAATVPALAAQLPVLVQRTGADGLPASPRPDATTDQPPRVQASDANFSLIALPATVGARPGDDPAAPQKAGAP